MSNTVNYQYNPYKQILFGMLSNLRIKGPKIKINDSLLYCNKSTLIIKAYASNIYSYYLTLNLIPCKLISWNNKIGFKRAHLFFMW